MQALDELVARWRKNPDPESTLALCAHLGTTRQSELLREVGNTAEAWHRDNPSVMLSVGRMYLDAGLLPEAQAAFVQAGKLAPVESDAYRFLGEVLLRRGDAVRAEKALARAIKLGADDAATRLWHERSVVYGALQKRKGLTAVADEVARTAPHQPSIPAPTLSPFESEPAPANRTTRRSRPPTAPGRPSGPRRSLAPGPRRRGSTPPPAGAAKPAPLAGAAKTAPLETLLMGRSPVPVAPFQAPVHPPSPFFPSDSHSPRPPLAGRKAPVPIVSALPKPGAFAKDKARAVNRPRPETAAMPVERITEIDTYPEPVPSDPFRGTFPDEPARTAARPTPSPPALPSPELDAKPSPRPVTPRRRSARTRRRSARVHRAF